MKASSIVTALLLGFVGVSVAYLVVEESSSTSVAELESAETADAGVASDIPSDAKMAHSGTDRRIEHKVTAYYFHRTKRCTTCLKIESLAAAALKDGFPEALASGVLEWRTANLEEPINEHFVTDFDLTSSALVLVDTWNGRQTKWVELGDVWDLYDDEPAYAAYVRRETAAYLEEGP